MKQAHRILLAPLDWGLGHTTRMIPIGKEFIRQGASLLLAGTPAQLKILSEAFPQSESLPLEGYQVNYGKHLPASWHVLLQMPRLTHVIRQEQKWASHIVPKFKITGIVSDNRYGLYHPSCLNIMVMHQFVPPLSGLAASVRPFLWQVHKRFLRHFDQIWIPDSDDEQSLGKGMRPPGLPSQSQFIGWQSRLSQINPGNSLLFQKSIKNPDLLILLSGPEPQRSILEQKVRRQIPDLGLTCWIVQGTPTTCPVAQEIPGGWLIPYMNAEDLAHWLPRAKVVMARSGYSSLMDFAILGLKQIILVPTPGQPEQNLLGRDLHRNKIACTVSQHSLSLRKALSTVPDFHGFEKSPISKDQITVAVGSCLT